MKQFFQLAMTLCLAIGLSTAVKADTIIPFGDIPLGPGGVGPSQSGVVTETILGIDVAFGYADSLDGSWSSDYWVTIIDPSGDTIGLGTGLGSGDISYDDGLPTGVDGAQNDTTAGGSYGTFFTLAQIQAIAPTFGEAGTYTAFFSDGWGGGGNTETLFSATVTFSTQAIPEPSSAMLLVGLTGLALAHRRRKS